MGQTQTFAEFGGRGSDRFCEKRAMEAKIKKNKGQGPQKGNLRPNWACCV
jgi:hypothetical protein